MSTLTFAQVIDACIFGDLETVIRAVLQGVDLTEENNLTLQRAAANGRLEIVKWLIEDSGQPIDATSNNNLAVRYAVAYGHLAVVKYLIDESGQQVNVADSNSVAVRWAAENAQLAMLKYLIEESSQQVDVTADNNWALREAATRGHTDIVNYLIADSGQLETMLLKNRSWISVLIRPQLEFVAVAGYGIDPTKYPHEDALRAALQQQQPLANTSVLMTLLNRLAISTADMKKYYLSAACRAAAATGFVTTQQELDAMLPRTLQQMEKHCRL